MAHSDIRALEDRYGAHNYAPMDVTLVHGEGIHVWDDEGRCLLDLMSAYSAVSHGHCHPRIVHVAQEQMARLSVTSRAYHNEWLGPFLERVCTLTGMDRALPMNSGAEAVETAIKAARKWAYRHKGLADNQAQIIVMDGNFHGRTTTIVSFSSESSYREGFGPLTPGFISVAYGDIQALSQAMGPQIAAVLVEPMQGEAGIRLPPTGWLHDVEALCRQHNVLLLVDEIQTGLGRTGRVLACEHEGVHPDGLMLGKALGGGLLPVSMFLAREDLMDVFGPGEHGSTFGGNPLAARVGLEALNVMIEENLPINASRQGGRLLEALRRLHHPALKEVRGIGLFIGMEFDPAYASAREFCHYLLEAGALSKDTHGTVARICPPLVIDDSGVQEAIDCITQALHRLPKLPVKL